MQIIDVVGISLMIILILTIMLLLLMHKMNH